MSDTKQTEWLKSAIESVPAFVFFLLWRQGFDLQIAAWVACVGAIIILFGFWRLRMAFDPILLGINVQFALVSPLIVAGFAVGGVNIGRFLISYAEGSVTVSIFIVGVVMCLFSQRGFIGNSSLSQETRRNYSLVLLAVSGASVPWSFAVIGNTMLSVVLPVMVLFGLRGFLLARAHDRHNGERLHGAALLGAPAIDVASDTLLD